MKISPEELTKRTDRFKQGLRQAGAKLTHQRLEVFRELAKSSDHPDAEAIHRAVCKRVPTISLDTVYRTLWLLLDLGLITTLGPSRERTRFDANLQSHHHFVCTACGMTRDFYSKRLDSLKVPASVQSFGQARTTNVEVRGLCLACASKRRGKLMTKTK